MSKILFLKGEEGKLPQELDPHNVYITTDTGKMFMHGLVWDSKNSDIQTELAKKATIHQTPSTIVNQIIGTDLSNQMLSFNTDNPGIPSDDIYKGIVFTDDSFIGFNSTNLVWFYGSHIDSIDGVRFVEDNVLLMDSWILPSCKYIKIINPTAIEYEFLSTCVVGDPDLTLDIDCEYNHRLIQTIDNTYIDRLLSDPRIVQLITRLSSSIAQEIYSGINPPIDYSNPTVMPDNFTVPMNGVIIFQTRRILGLGRISISINNSEIWNGGLIQLLTSYTSDPIQVHSGDAITSTGINTINFYPNK